jgi:hypothetical protein
VRWRVLRICDLGPLAIRRIKDVIGVAARELLDLAERYETTATEIEADPGRFRS